MITTRLLLKYKITVTEALTGFGYCYICIKNQGRGLSVESLTSREARQIVKEQNLVKESIDEYDYSLGTIYTDGKFKKYVNNHPKVKERLIKVIDILDK